MGAFIFGGNEKNSTVLEKKFGTFLQGKHSLAIWSINYMPRNLPKWFENYVQKNLHIDIYTNLTPNCQELEAVEIPFNT